MDAPSIMRPLRAATIVGVIAAGLITTGAASASTKCETWGGQAPNVGTGYNQLYGIAATSACNGLAVGYYDNGTAYQTLIERWNGKAWEVQTSANPGTSANDNVLSDVAALSPKSAWAVGYYDKGPRSPYQTLIEHWNGKAWKVQKSPNPGTSANNNQLSGVAALSSKNVWAVGYYDTGTATKTLIEHWNGKRWSVQSSPSPGQSCSVRAREPRAPRRPAIGRVAVAGRVMGLSSVTAASSSNAWAVGQRCGRHTSQTLVEHWNGRVWKVQRSPNPGGARNPAGFSGVAATSPTNAWAVGSYSKNSRTPGRTLVERWNGDSWKVQASANVNPSRDSNGLFDVAGTSPTSAWAVGSYGGMLDPAVIERWNGKAWKIQPSANFPDGSLFSVAAVSSQDAWAAGSYFNSTNDVNQNLILHCC
ncbi:MAG TPA: hypothetical protein VFB39_09840 [Solirubrobacteraceae bacterium]|nr:hypothetical protein [Solirubrobacteraceae bacterium]